MQKKFMVVVKFSNKTGTFPITASDIEGAYSVVSKLLGRDGYILDCIELI